jgi:hypothetical protein
VSKLVTSRPATAAAEARLGSRPSALPKANSFCLALTATARPEPSVRSLPSHNVASSSMRDRPSSRFVEKHAMNRARLAVPDIQFFQATTANRIIPAALLLRMS